VGADLSPKAHRNPSQQMARCEDKPKSIQKLAQVNVDADVTGDTMTVLVYRLQASTVK
jgi:hypothetical protein